MTYAELAEILTTASQEAFATNLERYRLIVNLHARAYLVDQADEPDKEAQLAALHAEYEALP